MDGLSLHWTKESKAAYARLKFYPLKNMAYNSPMNAIEQVWRVVKLSYRRKLLKFLASNEARTLNLFDFVKEILHDDFDLDFDETIARKWRELAELTGARVRVKPRES